MNKYQIYCYHTALEDSYENGEGRELSTWDDTATIKANSPLEAVKKYYDEQLSWDWVPENVDIDGNLLHDSILIDKDGAKATESEIDLWKRGEFELYSDRITISVQQLVEVLI